MWLRHKKWDKQSLPEIIKGCVDHQSGAQKVFVEMYYGYISTICRLYSKNHDEVQEMINDAFLKVLNHIQDYHADKSLKAWMRTITVHSCIDYFRKYGKMAGIFPLSTVELVPDDADILSSLGAEEVLSLVHKLPPSSRMVFLLYVMEGYQHKEIATMLEIQEGTSKSNLRDARIKLRQWVAQQRDTHYVSSQLNHSK